jgi:enediyne biosynthesis protein E4
MRHKTLSIFTAFVALVSCSLKPTPSSPIPLSGPQVGAQALFTPLQQSACSGNFVVHTLDHQTQVDGRVHLFESNGSGLAIGDLNQDSRPDLVLANLDGDASVLWNQSNLQFRTERLAERNTRAVAIVDVDGDNLLDIAFTHLGSGVSAWLNQGTGSFHQTTLPGVLAPAYSMAWGDLNSDGALDLVTGSYDTELSRQSGGVTLEQPDAGVYVYLRDGERYNARRLAQSSQALAIALFDVDNDQRLDIIVGNDFTVPDVIWRNTGTAWLPAEPFNETAESTMSFASGDIDNNGQFELFATDMKPFDTSPHVLAAWLPVMAKMPQVHRPDDPQIMANVLQMQNTTGIWHNEAALRGIDASGWSWSAKFGDLNNDGWLDLYTVNGMIAAELFGHLPGDELVEPNQAFQNRGQGYFQPAPAWNLGATASGRGMSMTDLDQDGDLDIVVNNLQSTAQLFENQICLGNGLNVALHNPKQANTQAIGATLALYTNRGVYSREVTSASGYLSGDAPVTHFGIPADATIDRLEVRWPDDFVSVVYGIQPQTALLVTRED